MSPSSSPSPTARPHRFRCTSSRTPPPARTVFPTISVNPDAVRFYPPKRRPPDQPQSGKTPKSKRPRGAAPKGKVWDDDMGDWTDDLTTLSLPDLREGRTELIKELTEAFAEQDADRAFALNNRKKKYDEAIAIAEANSRSLLRQPSTIVDIEGVHAEYSSSKNETITHHGKTGWVVKIKGGDIFGQDPPSISMKWIEESAGGSSSSGGSLIAVGVPTAETVSPARSTKKRRVKKNQYLDDDDDDF